MVAISKYIGENMMKFKSFLLILLCCAMLLSAAGCQQQPTPTEPPHQHTFADWKLQQAALCSQEGRENRQCSQCGFTESRSIPKLAHTMGDYNICKKCKYVEFDPNASLVELGVFSNYYVADGTAANRAWDIKVWGNMVYRGAGDYDKNAGAASIIAFNKDTHCWTIVGTTADEAVHRFVEIGGTLYTPGIDPTGSWDLGNYYVREGENWKQVRNLPNGLHNFDMIGFDGKIFAGLGTEVLRNTVAVSQDGGTSWDFVPLYRDGALLDTSGYEHSRTYAFVEYGGNLYALIQFKKQDVNSYDMFVFRYNNGKMVYQSVASSRLTGKTGGNYWQGKLEWKGVCYLTSTVLNAITDFSNPETHKQIAMPSGGVVTDILLHNDQLYVLSYTFKQDMTCNVAIYQSATGAEGSFTEVVSFDYAAFPISFDFDGSHFYIGTGQSYTDQAKSGMVLRVKP